MKMRIAVVGLACFSSGCISFQGSPSPLFTMKSQTDLAKIYPLDEVFDSYYGAPSKRGNLTQEQYRNKVITIYREAIDARYDNFKAGLSSQNKVSNLGLESLALVLSSGASFAGKATANALSAGSALALGTNTKINEKLFYEKTIDAVIASMNTARYEAEVNIINGMALSADKYPMHKALADLSAYERSADIGSAIARINADVFQREAAGKEVLDSVRKNDEDLSEETDSNGVIEDESAAILLPRTSGSY